MLIIKNIILNLDEFKLGTVYFDDYCCLNISILAATISLSFIFEVNDSNSELHFLLNTYHLHFTSEKDVLY